MWCLLLICWISPLAAGYPQFDANPFISEEVKEKIRPFLLPDDHPMRGAMDLIFPSTRVIGNEETFQNAGFEILYRQKRSFILVGRHPMLPDHLVKANLDDNREMKFDKPAWWWFVKRCKGVRQVQRVIEDYDLKYCVAPKKYLYAPLYDPLLPLSMLFEGKIVVLLVEDMHLVDKATNKLYWKTIVTKEHLDELYLVLSKANGHSYRPDNIPFTVDQKIAFIDTEYPSVDPDFESIRKYLSEEMQIYWDSLQNIDR